MYFKKFLNKDLVAKPEILNQSLEEIQYAIQTLKNNKLPMDDKIVTELFKLRGQSLTQKLHNLIQHI